MQNSGEREISKLFVVAEQSCAEITELVILFQRRAPSITKV